MTLLAELDAVDKTYNSTRRPSWLEMLPDDARQELLEIRKRFQDGRWKKMSRSAVADRLVEYAKQKGWSVIRKRGIAEWLGKRD